ncbi:MAG: hypothetical protein JNM78_03610 [Cyclobacteriaceae bacterium]|nr:hypothetical protein [Cyclobacteriaceae bacterium]
MRKILTITVIITFTFKIAHTQELRPGFIVTNKNDTVKGFITYQTDAILKNKVEFKISKNDQITIYSAEDVSSFGFENGRFFERITSNDAPNVFFAKRTLTGKLNFYSTIQSKKGKEFYIQNSVSGERVHLKKSAKTESALKSLYYLGLINKVKNDSITQFQNQEKVKFSEADIRKDLFEYNKKYEQQFPTNEYKEEKRISYDISIGSALMSTPDVNMRLSGFRNSYNPERNRLITFISGVTYQRWNYSDRRIAEAEGDPWLRNNVKLIPIGINFQKIQGKVRPYIYSGLGVILSFSTYEFVQTTTFIGANGGPSYTTTQLITINENEVGPTIVIGAGLKVKTGSKFMFFEVVPANSGLFLNLGISF